MGTEHAVSRSAKFSGEGNGPVTARATPTTATVVQCHDHVSPLTGCAGSAADGLVASQPASAVYCRATATRRNTARLLRVGRARYEQGPSRKSRAVLRLVVVSRAAHIT